MSAKINIFLSKGKCFRSVSISVENELPIWLWTHRWSVLCILSSPENVKWISHLLYTLDIFICLLGFNLTWGLLTLALWIHYSLTCFIIIVNISCSLWNKWWRSLILIKCIILLNTTTMPSRYFHFLMDIYLSTTPWQPQFSFIFILWQRIDILTCLVHY